MNGAIATAARHAALLMVLCCPVWALAIDAPFGLAVLSDAAAVVQGAPSSVSFEVSTRELAGTALPSYPIVLGTGVLPAGVSAAYSALSITDAGTAILSVITDGTTPPGTYPIDVFAATVDMVTPAATQVTLTVLPAPDFLLSAASTPQSVVQGAAASYALTAASLNGFAGQIQLTLAGLPAGASATFLPATIPASGAAALTIATSAATPAGSYALTLTATSGSLQHTLPLQLVVTAAAVSYTLAVSPGAQSIPQGSATSYVVSTLLSGGIGPASNALQVSGLPAGSTATFIPAATTGNTGATLTVTTSAGTPPGSYALTVSSALAPAMTVQLTVTAVGTSPPSTNGGDIPLPGWALVLLALGLMGQVKRRAAAVASKAP